MKNNKSERKQIRNLQYGTPPAVGMEDRKRPKHCTSSQLAASIPNSHFTPTWRPPYHSTLHTHLVAVAVLVPELLLPPDEAHQQGRGGGEGTQTGGG